MREKYTRVDRIVDPRSRGAEAEDLEERLNVLANFYGAYLAHLANVMVDKGLMTVAEADATARKIAGEMVPTTPRKSNKTWFDFMPTCITANLGPDGEDEGG